MELIREDLMKCHYEQTLDHGLSSFKNLRKKSTTCHESIGDLRCQLLDSMFIVPDLLARDWIVLIVFHGK